MEETIEQLAERIEKMRVAQLKEDSEAHKEFLKSRSLEIVPVIQVDVGGGNVGTMEVSKFINTPSGYILRHTE